MAGRKRTRRSRGGIIGIITMVLVLALGGIGYTLGWIGGDRPADTSAPIRPASDPVTGETVSIHIIDVGQGDSILIRTPEGDMLIDAGTNSSEDELKAYLDAQGVTAFKWAVFTHPHEDHIGGADMVLASYKVDTVIIPDKDTTTKVYERMLDGIESNGSALVMAKPDYSFKLGGVTFTLLAPIGTGYKDINNYSVVVRADYGTTSALFTGDAEDVSENEMLARYGSSGLLDCDLLKVGHHGSDSSSTEPFLKAVSPAWAVISVGEGNTYGHPKAVTLEKLDTLGIPYYRTDQCGSVVFVTDGKNMTLNRK